MTVGVYIPKDCKFRVEPTMKFKVRTTVKVYDPMDWKFRVEKTIKFKVETAEQNLKNVVVFWIFLKKTSENQRETRKSDYRGRSNRR